MTDFLSTLLESGKYTSMEKQNLKRHIKNGYTEIHLPVPLGSPIYIIVTDCQNQCRKFPETFDNLFPKKKNGRCSHHMPCHTKLHTIKKNKLKFSNLEYTLAHWGITIFPSREKAEAQAENIINTNRQTMKMLHMETP